MTEGKVWLVGAGPGDTGLITVKGEQVLKEAQVVVYDHLVNPDLLARYGDGKRFINVGKQGGTPSHPPAGDPGDPGKRGQGGK